MANKILLIGKRNYLVGNKGKFSTQFGELDLSKAKVGKKIKTHLGEEFFVVEPRTPDLLRKIKRMPQIITLKDAGLIVSYTGLNKTDTVVEAGTGSGYLTIILAGIAKKIYSYEQRKEFYEVAKENLSNLGINNVVLKNSDIKSCKEKNADIFILDLGNPEKYTEKARKSLKPGGFLVVYCPVLEQVQRLNWKGFENVETRELILREWNIGEEKTRPKTRMLGHTGFLTFARKV